MNFLAHIHLAYPDKEAMIGGFIADGMRRVQLENYTPAIQRGIFLHWEIDRYTDAHPQTKKSIQRLRESQGKYAAVIVDILYDHMLAAHWDTFMPEVDLLRFSHDFYALANQYHKILPPRYKHLLLFMQKDNWLYSYRTIEGIKRAFYGMSRRADFANNMQNAQRELEENYDLYKNEFMAFYPEMQNHVVEFLKH